VGFGALLLGLAACGGGGDAPPVGVYSEFLAYEEVDAALPELARRGTDLNVAVPSDRIDDPALADLLRAAEERRVPVRLWLVLSRDDGYWPNEGNAELFRSEVQRLLARLSADRLRADAVVYDLEPALAYSEQLEAALSSDLAAVTELMRAHLDPAAFAAARAVFAASVEDVHAAGLRAVAVTYPQVVDDLADGDDDLQDGLDVPVEGVPWDEVAFMVYQTGFAAAVGGWIGPGLVASFAADARAHLGDRAVIALGQVGRPGIFETTGPVYEDPSVLEADIAAARFEGIGRVEVYSLDGMLELGGARRWLDATAAAPAEAAPTSQARLVRSLAEGLDGTLD
jgi:hypothetical protein